MVLYQKNCAYSKYHLILGLKENLDARKLEVDSDVETVLSQRLIQQN